MLLSLKRTRKFSEEQAVTINSGMCLALNFLTPFRLHQGLHYPRSYITRIQTLEGFTHFMDKYGFLTTSADYNLYGVASKNTLIDFGTYKQIMDASGIENSSFQFKHFGLDGLEGSVICEERVLFHDAPRVFFMEKLHVIIKLNTPVSKVILNNDNTIVNGEKFDWCLNCSYLTFNPLPSLNLFYEPCLSLVYQDIRETPFPRVAMTIMDGKFPSLFPYISNEDDLKREDRVYYTLTNVEYTPLGQFTSFEKAEARRLHVQNNPDSEVSKLIPLFEAGIKTFYPQFKNHFKYHSFFTSMKTKPYNTCDSRECLVDQQNRFISVMSGKVNSLHVAEDLVKQIIMK